MNGHIDSFKSLENTGDRRTSLFQFSQGLASTNTFTVGLCVCISQDELETPTPLLHN